MKTISIFCFLLFVTFISAAQKNRWIIQFMMDGRV